MQKNKGLSVLRGIFILMIVLHHLNLYYGGGPLGVAFFFMLGGFVLSLGYYDKFCLLNFSWRAFIKKRCAKFFPLHWLCLLAVLPLALLPIIRGGADFKTILWPLLSNVLLLQSLIPSQDFYFSFNAVSWYLSDTMIFAMLFPIIVKATCKLSNTSKVVALVVILLAYSVLVYFLPIEDRHAILYISPLVRVVDFILGIYLFLLYKKLTNHKTTDNYLNGGWPELLVSLMVVISIVVSCISSEDIVLISAIYWLPLSIMLILTSLTTPMEGKIYNLIIWIGDISLPIFLTHQVIIRYVNSFFGFIGIDNYPSSIYGNSNIDNNGQLAL